MSRTKIKNKRVSRARAVLRAQVRFLFGFSLILQQTTFVVTYDRFDWVEILNLRIVGALFLSAKIGHI